jgi:hypothetical protein
MESALNLGWLALTLSLIGLWRCGASAVSTSRRAQLVALGLVIFILLPVISVTDDLWIARHPAEIVMSVAPSSDHHWLYVHAASPTPLMLFVSRFACLSPRFIGMVAQDWNSLSAQLNPALMAIDNRPPPRA